MPDIVPLPADYAAWLAELKARIHTAQQRAALAVNRELVLLYWQIGRDCLARQGREGWGAKVIERLAQDLRNAFPEMKGFSRANLMYMRAFAEAWPEEAVIVQQAVGQLPWGHNLVLLTKLKAPELRLAYAQRAIEHGWSRNVLSIHIERRLLEREGKAVSNFALCLPKPHSDLAHESLKDPYLFDFLGVGNEAGERAIEDALVHHITHFLLELGAGFAFVGRQVHLEVGGEDFFIDLLFYAMLIASNGTDSRVGSLTADWRRFFKWKRIAREDEPRRVSMEVMLRGVCDRTRLLDLLENFTLFSEHKAGLVKILGQNHQVLGVNNAVASMLEARRLGHGRAGVFWQTQGSGKSFSMVFLAQKVLRTLIGNWTFVVVTDRVELDEQIAKTFKAASAVSEAEGDQCHAASSAHLRELLRGNHRYVFTLIHKFQTPELLCDRPDVIVLTDEAHRSQYDTLALNMRAALPKALFLAFTGTPLIAGEERTKEVFGDYVSIYDFQQSVEDGATVPLFYENRTPELQLVNPDLNEAIYQLIEEAELDPEQEEKLERELSRQYHILTRDDRLETVARDIVRHFLGRGFLGKAMVVSIDKTTALRMHDKVRQHLRAETGRVQEELSRPDLTPSRQAELLQRLDVLSSTDMALIVSPGQNEIAQMKERGLDIEPHRQRMNASQPPLDEQFKDTGDPLRLVFVCAMWLTGFDAPSCSTVYLDKPMRNHTLMQTIARANRVFPGKHSGVIVDYANVFVSLEKALAIYGAGKGGQNPVKDKQKLVEALRHAVADATAYCATHRVSLSDIEQRTAGSMERLQGIEDAIDALIAPDTVRRDFFAHQRLVATLYRAVKPDPVVLELVGRVAAISTIATAIRAKLNPDPPDISEVMGGINALLDDSITGMTIQEHGPPALDLSKINFEALAQRFKQSKHKNTDLEVLKAAIRAQLEKLIRLNRTRTDFAQKFEELIESYNTGSRNIEELFEQLVVLSRSLNEEQERHVRENMTEEELVIFDILTRPAPELSPEERAEVKKVARELLERLKQLLVLNWRKKATARSQLRLAIEDALDSGLPRAYTPDIYKLKCTAVFEHFYESYPEWNGSVYGVAA